MKRLKCCKAGSILLKIFLVLVCIFGALYLYDFLKPPLGFSQWHTNRTLFIIGAVAVILLCSWVFWAGILLTYICCNQLRLKKRVLGIVFAWVPIANIVMLLDIIRTADDPWVVP